MAINNIEMITDRSLSDVEIAKSLIKKGLQSMTESEKQAFLLGLKGAYNYTDVNRVEGAIKYLCERLYLLPDELKEYADELGVKWLELLDVPYDAKAYKNVVTKENWSRQDIWIKEERDRYIENVFLVLDALNIDISNVPNTMDKLNYSGANEIEKSLETFNVKLIELEEEKRKLIKRISIQWYFYSGEIFGGEV
jgi:tetratricopeptide (TPR) repeat protein